ncbi:helix-turn-helix domain-containing protein [Nocardioides sp. W7]|uniref:helix-turn-helix domain-containing protein n=1 Tax=Nocardioides sp. W7 TaxID=2931390 RepID=UPI001FD305C9|nr:helix-turn-helix domain-containing protein [Nocardioides sp. W7]
MPHVRPLATVESALRASDAGMSDAENARRHGVAVKTIRRWRRDYQRRGLPLGQSRITPPCPRCDGGPLDEPAYAELLGWYLGDGHITAGRRGVWNLHVVNDAKYSHDIDRIAALMTEVKPGARPHRRCVPGAVIVTSSWKHWCCLFPQHGPGRKHERRIELEDWQRTLVDDHPDRLLRGLFHSDGSRVRNWATRTVAGEAKRYEYPRWQFSNRSEDILELCCHALDLAGVAWRRSSRWHVSVSTREAVARLDALIGLKT